MKMEEYADRDMLAMDLANRLVGDLENALLRHEVVSFAVPGGTTPGPIFDVLAASTLDWSRVRVMATDERWVSEGHSRSNASMIADRLLTGRAAAATLLPFYRAGMAEAEGAQAVSEAVAPLLPVSVLLLGMGEDCHVASLFPDAPDLAEALADEAPAVVAQHPASQPEARVSLSAKVLDGALAKHLVIFGEAKRTALADAPQDAPVRRVLGDMTVHWAP